MDKTMTPTTPLTDRGRDRDCRGDAMTPTEIQNVLADHAAWLRDPSQGARANLRGADLRGADLRGADLRRANLRGANLHGANLRYADLRYADLRYADLRGADLTDADLTGADLTDADLRTVDITGANLSHADLRGADLRTVDLRSVDLTGAAGLESVPTALRLEISRCAYDAWVANQEISTDALVEIVADTVDATESQVRCVLRADGIE